jgi:serine protease inhibitor
LAQRNAYAGKTSMRFCASLLLPNIALLLFAPVRSFAQEGRANADLAQAEPQTLEVADRYNQLGISLFAAVRQAKAGNVVVSSWPTRRSLALAFLASTGDTREEIAKVLGSADPVADETRLLAGIDPDIAAWNGLTASPQPGNRADQVQWATLSGLWVDPRATIKPAFAALALRMHGTTIRALDFQNSGKAIADVNEWVAKMTHGRVAHLLDGAAFTEDTRLALSSVTFFKAPWAYRAQFKRENTRSEPFHVKGGAAQPVPTMAQRTKIGSAVHETFTALTLPTAGGFHLLLLVPAQTSNIEALEARVTPELLQNCARLEQTRIELHLPRFRIGSATLALRPILQTMGMRLAFDRAQADFSALSSTPLYLSDVFDAAEFRIDEDGLSGAGATVATATALGGDVSTLPAESTFRVDRPFLFALQHAASGYCVFLGKVIDPR